MWSGIDDLVVLLDKAAAAGPVGLVYITNSIIGKALTFHAHWHGLLDLTNSEQRDRARHYGHPPKAAQHVFRVTAEAKAQARASRVRPSAPKNARRPSART